MMMEFGISDTPILKPRRFDKVDILTGTPEPDAFEVQGDGQIFFNPIITNEIINGKNGNDIYTTQGGVDTFKTHLGHVTIKDFTPNEGDKLLLLGGVYSNEDEIIDGKNGSVIYTGGGGADTFKTHIGHVTIKDFTPNEGDKLLLLLNEEPSLFNSSEVDILVYQEQDRAAYLEGFQAPTARSFTYIEEFEPIEDEIIVGGITYAIKIDENDIPMLTDDIQPAFGM